MKNRVLEVFVYCHNYRETIEKCLECLMNQTFFDDTKIVVFDDNSDDGSLDIIDSYTGIIDEIVPFSEEFSGKLNFCKYVQNTCKAKYCLILDGRFWIENPSTLQSAVEKLDETKADVLRMGIWKYVYGLVPKKIDMSCYGGLTTKASEIKMMLDGFENNFIFKSSIIQTSFKNVKKMVCTNYLHCSKREDVAIDFVFPYVDFNDPNWRKDYDKFAPKKESEEDDWKSGEERYRDFGVLKYMFRSIAKNLPWVNRVHMLVACESQVPDWVDRENVHIVCHKDFIPEGLLPTFNSSTIEMFLGNIPELAENFIYSNDDIYITKRLYQTHFFDENQTPKFLLTKREMSDNAPGDVMRRNDINVLRPRKFPKNSVLLTQHICTPHKLSNIQSVYEKHEKQILKSCTKFRDDTDLNQYLFLYNLYFQDKMINQGLGPKLSTCVDEHHNWNQDFSKFKLCCLNDSSDSTEEEWDIVKSKLNKLFPRKCKYEI